MDDDQRTVLHEEIEAELSYLMGAMRGISDRYRELGSGSGTGRGFGINAAYRENNLNSGAALARWATDLAAEAAEIADRCSAIDAKRALLKATGDAG
ncbi:hypothetical protein [Embleya hyalina]|uniref:Uncharacterized protein n=1 Tax=Embleya hyalina TaxID=516124 RepID=A0A401YXB0_9ACTN|nr:hypothetical protein [Embleya hyalina]GCD99257.1 hypothetical protein EHYA_06971 [Embleya hyalina]